ncbi:unnamed protein product [Rhodiola kirilowii]
MIVSSVLRKTHKQASMLLSAFHPQSNSHSNLFFLPPISIPSKTPNRNHSQLTLAKPSPFSHFINCHEINGGKMVPSASAVAATIRRASTSPVEFVQRVESEQKSSLVLPSADFQRLCVEQMDLFRRIVDCDALISVYVRPAGSYVMDRLELRRVALYPSVETSEIVILIGNFSIPSGLRVAEAALANQQVEVIPECSLSLSSYVMPQTPSSVKIPWDVQTAEDKQLSSYKIMTEQRLNAINITRSIAMAYVLDQKAMLLQQSSWQNNVRMSNLVEQIRGPLSSIRTLSKMLSVHLKRSEVAYDIAEDILVQGDAMRNTLQQLQDAVYLTKSNIIRYNEETFKKIHGSSYKSPESSRSQLSDDSVKDPSDQRTRNIGTLSLSSAKDLEMPMPPLALAPLQQQGVRPCNVSDILADLVGAVRPLARDQQRVVELRELSLSLEVAVEEPSLRQALSNLIEGALLRTQVGGKVEIVSTSAPAGGALVLIDDDGPDMHYMTQMHSLTPFGPELLSENMLADNMTWNFVAGLTIAREILESYGCVLRIISPRDTNGVFGAGGTRIELWLPSYSSSSNLQSQSA